MRLCGAGPAFSVRKKQQKVTQGGTAPLRIPQITGAVCFAPVAQSVWLIALPTAYRSSASLLACVSVVPAVSSAVSSRGSSVRRSPLLGSLSLTGRQPGSFNHQSPRRRTGYSRGTATLHVQPMFETKEVRDLGPGVLLGTFPTREKYPRARGGKPRREQIEKSITCRPERAAKEKKEL